ncbi:MAG: DUF4382 domain-containing protein [candidate division Zixibacteria bacterium]|nr:DUF4382 domain-containing protein [candidate division Zixibacteria bacterium]
MIKLFVLIIVGVSAIFIFCSGDPYTPEVETGLLEIYLQDSPADYESVFITIDSLGSRSTDNSTGELTILYSGSEKFNVVNLRNGSRCLLVSKELPEGSIGSVRIVFGQCRVVINRISYDLYFSPPACSTMEVSGRVIFNKNRDGIALLDINLMTSISYDSVFSRYVFEPDISLLDIDSTGSIYGTIIPPHSDIYLFKDSQEPIAYTYAAGIFGFYGLTRGLYDSIMCAPHGLDTLFHDTLMNYNYPIYPGAEYDMLDLELPELGG